MEKVAIVKECRYMLRTFYYCYSIVFELNHMDYFLLRKKPFIPLLNQNASFVCLLSLYICFFSEAILIM